MIVHEEQYLVYWDMSVYVAVGKYVWRNIYDYKCEDYNARMAASCFPEFDMDI